eukprot:CAMPEP_0170316218 /NCGR_PEP_ID=MMETSP0116_2-20130129/58731_1 /TAXON_ID=400756 /ORGANISM="Durinskia baltica, Strain CSIRO CS-38" /LENGTH=90 /DNA_ID=CAMNT_0010568765 /DNA_START=11 /DNA_END=279 /DNA_ORIENTATION=-
MSPWGAFDLIFMTLSVAFLFLIPLPGSTTSKGIVRWDDLLSRLLALRIFRLFRLTRSISYLVQYSELWTMCKAMLSAARAIMYAMLLGAT